MGHCCLFDLARVPNYLQALDMLDILNRSERVTLRFWPISPHLHGRKWYFIQICISPLLFVCFFIPVYYFHTPPPSPPFQLAQLARQRSPRAPCACIYVGGNRIGKVIEKLSCRSGWFVEPVHALIHPAAPPHK